MSRPAEGKWGAGDGAAPLAYTVAVFGGGQMKRRPVGWERGGTRSGRVGREESGCKGREQRRAARRESPIPCLSMSTVAPASRRSVTQARLLERAASCSGLCPTLFRTSTLRLACSSAVRGQGGAWLCAGLVRRGAPSRDTSWGSRAGCVGGPHSCTSDMDGARFQLGHLRCVAAPLARDGTRLVRVSHALAALHPRQSLALLNLFSRQIWLALLLKRRPATGLSRRPTPPLHPWLAFLPGLWLVSLTLSRQPPTGSDLGPWRPAPFVPAAAYPARSQGAAAGESGRGGAASSRRSW